MTDNPLTKSELEALRALDTPTVCNALELEAPERRGFGYTTQPLVCAFPQLPPLVGYARTALIRTMRPSAKDKAEAAAQRIGYYAYVEQGPGPTIAVIQDGDSQPGYGAFWGEVNTHIHAGLGCLGTITNGSVRDLDAIAPGFQLLAGLVGPSHAWVHLAEYGNTVNIHGMTVQDGDLLHADRHGAVIIPHQVARKIAAAADVISRREAVILQAAKAPGFTAETLRQAMAEAEGIP